MRISRSLTINKTILIAGAGELGLRLGRRLIPNAKIVAVRRRSFFYFENEQVQEHRFSGNWQALLEQFCPQHLVISWAPSERSHQAYRSLYIDELSNLLSAAAHHGRPDILQISSSAVWEAEDGRHIDDQSPMPPPQDQRGKILLEAEDLTQEYGIQQQRKICTLRLSGLYGPQRWPGLRRLRQTTPITENPAGWVNLLHIEDASIACELALQHALEGRYLVSAESILREKLYHFAHLHFDTPPPIWERKTHELGRRIDSRIFSEQCLWKPTVPRVCDWIQKQDLEN